jgi:hypothetical protein
MQTTMGAAEMEATEHRLSEVEDRCENLYRDMYLGNGKDNPPMTVRIDRMEAYMQEARDTSEETHKQSVATKRLMIATMLSVLGTVIGAFICYKLGVRV